MELTTHRIPTDNCCTTNKEHHSSHYHKKNDPRNKKGCCHHYDSSKLTFVDPDTPTYAHKKYNGKIQQTTQPPVSLRYNEHKRNDPQVRWSRNNIAMTMEYFEPISSTSSPVKRYGNQADYSYAYYEPGAVMCHSNIPAVDKSGPSTSSPKSIRALLAKPKNDKNQSDPKNRHMYTTRYGTQENIYEDVSSIGARLGSQSSVQSLSTQNCSKSEFENILHNHYRVLEELNLSVEELLLSTTTKTNLSPRKITKRSSKPRIKVRNSGTLTGKSDFHTSMHELMIGEDSGFSGSSSGASYIGSLRNYKTALARPLRTSSENNSLNNCGTFPESVKLSNNSQPDSFHMMNQSKGEKGSDSAKSFKFSFWNKR